MTAPDYLDELEAQEKASRAVKFWNHTKYITELRNAFPRMAAELRELRAKEGQATVRPLTLDDSLALVVEFEESVRELIREANGSTQGRKDKARLTLIHTLMNAGKYNFQRKTPVSG